MSVRVTRAPHAVFVAVETSKEQGFVVKTTLDLEVVAKTGTHHIGTDFSLEADDDWVALAGASLLTGATAAPLAFPAIHHGRADSCGTPSSIISCSRSTVGGGISPLTCTMPASASSVLRESAAVKQGDKAVMAVVRPLKKTSLSDN